MIERRRRTVERLRADRNHGATTARRCAPGEPRCWAKKPSPSAGRSPIPTLYVLDRDGRRQGIGVAGELADRRRRPGPRLLAAGRRWPPTASCPIPSPAGPAPASTVPATSPAGGSTASSNTSAGSISRSRCAASASSWAKSKARWRRIPAVADRVVVARPATGRRNPPGGLRGAARPRPAAEPTRSSRLFLGRTLPSLHDPGRLRLPAGAAAHPQPQGRPQGPAGARRSPAAGERRGGRRKTRPSKSLHQIYCEVLDLEKVDADANFFVLGGHSLLATQVLARIRDSFRPQGAAAHLLPLPHHRPAGRRWSPKRCRPPRRLSRPNGPLGARARAAPLPLAAAPAPLRAAPPAPAAIGAHHLRPGTAVAGRPARRRPPTASYNITNRCSGCAARLDAEPPAPPAFDRVIDRHAILRTAIEAGGRPAAASGCCPALEWQLGAVELHGRSGSRTRHGDPAPGRRARASIPFALDGSRRSFQIAARPHRRTSESWLLSVFHHAIFDNHSFAILFAELDELYAALAESRPRAAAARAGRSQLTEVALRQHQRAERRRAGRRSRLLAPPPGRRPAAARAAHRPAAAADARASAAPTTPSACRPP